MKYDRAASKRRFHCSDSIDIELSSPSSFFRLVFLFFTRAAPLDCFPCPFQPSIVPSYHLRARACLFFHDFFLLFPICLLFFFFNHISVSLSRYTRALASWHERCKSVCWNVSQLRCPELSFISPLFFLFFSLLFLSLPSRSYSLSTELGSLSLLQLFSSYNTVSPSPSYYFSISFATISIGFFSFLWWGGRFLFHPFSQPPLEVNESRRLSSFTRHRFHVGRRRAANRVNSSPLVERESVFPFHRGGAILPASKRPDLFTSIRSPLLIPLLRNRRFLACE